jgi:hypothetical protein
MTTQPSSPQPKTNKTRFTPVEIGKEELLEAIDQARKIARQEAMWKAVSATASVLAWISLAIIAYRLGKLRGKTK